MTGGNSIISQYSIMGITAMNQDVDVWLVFCEAAQNNVQVKGDVLTGNTARFCILAQCNNSLVDHNKVCVRSYSQNLEIDGLQL